MQEIVLYGADWCGDCHRARQYFADNGIDYEYKNIDSSQAIKGEMLKITDGSQSIPAITVGGKLVAQEPSNQELQKLFGNEAKPSDNHHDVIMVGAGPASLSAAIYTTREDIDTLLFERGVVGGLAAVTDKIDNYPGYEDGVEGLKLSDSLRKQAERFGAVIELGEVTKLSDEGKYKKLETTSGDMYAKAVLIATGSDYKKVGVPGEKEYYARGVHYCATCDGAFYRGKKLVVVGGGNSAVQESIFLTRFASHIDLLVRSTIKASDVLQKDLQKFINDGKITVHLQTATDEIIGEDNKVIKVIGTNKAKGEKVEFATDGVFVFVGLSPNSEFLKGTAVELDAIGFVKTDVHLQTVIPGVFAAGDIRSGATMQIASATGEGATAALIIREYLEGKLAPTSESTKEVAPAPIA
ncbi:MAG: FAD-dependent oxidoreductase [Candidatus Saccharimonadales bacterium]